MMVRSDPREMKVLKFDKNLPALPVLHGECCVVWKFFKSANKEWQKLDPHVKNLFKTQLKKRIKDPHVASARLRGYPNLYKIKLGSVGYRLAYLVEDQHISVYVICVGRRDKIYKILSSRGVDFQKGKEESKGRAVGHEKSGFGFSA